MRKALSKKKLQQHIVVENAEQQMITMVDHAEQQMINMLETNDEKTYVDKIPTIQLRLDSQKNLLVPSSKPTEYLKTSNSPIDGCRKNRHDSGSQSRTLH